jgi:putative heme-binding domain-containing protein
VSFTSFLFHEYWGRGLLCFALAYIAASPSSWAAEREPWSDPSLPKVAGLAAWYDAARTTGKKEEGPEVEVSHWQDASGNGRHLTQTSDKSQPTLQSVGDSRVVRFDGLDDNLFADGFKFDSRELTAILIASPFDNPGEFRGFLAGNKTGANDYVSGFTLDQGPFLTQRFEWLNPEGVGFGGAADVFNRSFDFGTPHILSLVVRPEGEQGVLTFVDGKGETPRARKTANLTLDRLTVGARCYDNFSGVPMIQGFLEGDIGEVLLFDRALSDEERTQVEAYLRTKHEKWLGTKTIRPVHSGEGERLTTVPCPDVQFFVPGFDATPLPLDLPNINNLRSRPDGKVFAVAYNGDVYLLSDSDNDGLEDQASLYWEGKGGIRSPIGAAVLPPGDPRGKGIAVACRGKISLLIDRDGDDRADEEVLAAEWKNEIVQSVDGLGVAIDPKDGAIYYGRGTSDYTTGYWFDKEGKNQYDIANDHGTIQRIAPDLKSRETIATGIRFSVGLAFNRRGDLFASEQEGATWVPNGNPFDELLHIRRGRHYGFPPRHPQYLPNVIDEPSEFDYGPQHQSTCGLQFNDPVAPEGKMFGPKSWAGDALVTGYSRAKLYRTKLVPSDTGYVAQNQLIAQFNMLLCDIGLTPQGDLLAAVHSGGPDWGTGPGGRGKLFKLRYRDPNQPQPVSVWPAGPREIRLAFDSPVDEASLTQLLDRLKIEAGSAVAAGDRFENLRPGYAIVARQIGQLRRQVPIYSAQLMPDRRTLVLATGPQSVAEGYGLTIFDKPVTKDAPLVAAASDSLPQPTADIDLGYDLTGVIAEWKSDAGDDSWSGWLPHVDPAISRELTQGSAEHDALWQRINKPGTLTIKTRLRLDNMLRPAVQPGSKLNYSLPDETVTVEIRGRGLQSVSADDKPVETQLGTARFISPARPLVSMTIVSRTDQTSSLAIDWHTSEDDRPRAFPLRRVLVPWAKIESDGESAQRELPPQLAGGSWGRGRKVFFDKEVGCAKCHSVHGQGTTIGPDLSNLIHRDYASVLRDIEQPSFAVNPDFIAHTYALNDGRVFAAVAKKVDGQLVLGTTKGERIVIDPSEIEEVTPSTQSIMPTEQVKTLGPDRMRDLLTFLLSPPPMMPLYAKNPSPPPARSAAEVAAALAGAPEPPKPIKQLNVLLVAGDKDHGLGEHDYPAWQTAWTELFRAADKIDVDSASPWPSPEQWAKADVVVFFQYGDFNTERAADLDKFFKRGGGAVYLHWAVAGREKAAGLADRIGLAAGLIKFRHGPLDLDFSPGKNHPIARNFDKVHFHDESYWMLAGDQKRISLIAQGEEEGAPRPLMWTTEPTNGRVFVSILGHYSWTFDDPLFRILVLRGVAWTAKEPVDRFNDLIPLGVK